jgi:hypothetical protein
VVPASCLARARPIASGPVRIAPRRLKMSHLSLHSGPMANFGIIRQGSKTSGRKGSTPFLIVPGKARRVSRCVVCWAAAFSAMEVLCSDRLQKKYCAISEIRLAAKVYFICRHFALAYILLIEETTTRVLENERSGLLFAWNMASLDVLWSFAKNWGTSFIETPGAFQCGSGPPAIGSSTLPAR